MNAIEKEKTCLLKSRDFVERATQSVSTGWPHVVSDAKFAAVTSMIGQIAAHQFDECMSHDAIVPQPTPKATTPQPAPAHTSGKKR